MTREQMHEMEERRERAILVFTPEQNETWQEEELYEELKELAAVCASGERIPIIRDGRFVLPGTEELNVPLDER